MCRKHQTLETAVLSTAILEGWSLADISLSFGWHTFYLGEIEGIQTIVNMKQNVNTDLSDTEEWEYIHIMPPHENPCKWAFMPYCPQQILVKHDEIQDHSCLHWFNCLQFSISLSERIWNTSANPVGTRALDALKPLLKRSSNCYFGCPVPLGQRHTVLKQEETFILHVGPCERHTVVSLTGGMEPAFYSLLETPIERLGVKTLLTQATSKSTPSEGLGREKRGTPTGLLGCPHTRANGQVQAGQGEAFSSPCKVMFNIHGVFSFYWFYNQDTTHSRYMLWNGELANQCHHRE